MQRGGAEAVRRVGDEPELAMSAVSMVPVREVHHLGEPQPEKRVGDRRRLDHVAPKPLERARVGEAANCSKNAESNVRCRGAACGKLTALRREVVRLHVCVSHSAALERG